jgi:hypothetical protein
MRHCFRLLPVLLLAGLVSTAAAAVQSDAVHQMAAILMNLNHFPTDAEKATLKKIASAKETTAHERTVAQALLNVQHKAAGEDREKLEGVIKDKAAPEDVRTLASIVLNLNHTPSAEDKAKLKKLASH